MSSTQPTKAPSASTTSTYRTSGLLAVLGAVAMGVAVFAPWLTNEVGDLSLTGWNLSEAAAGAQQWYIGDMFATFSPFFPGYAVLAMAALFALAGIGLTAVHRTISPITRLLMVLVPLAVLTALALNLYSVFALQDPKVVDPGWGLIASVAGGFLATVAIAYPGSRRR